MNEEFEVQPFGFCEYATPLDGKLPYNWDGGCHLVINNNFYSHSRQSSNGSPRTPDSLEFEVGSVGSVEKMDCIEMEENRMEINYENLAPTETSGSTANTLPPMDPIPKTCPEEIDRCKTLDEQLEFIMGRCKRPPKSSLIEKKCKRNRKTQEQIDLLNKEFDVDPTFGKARIHELAEKTGLTEMQVYKWFWDRKEK